MSYLGRYLDSLPTHAVLRVRDGVDTLSKAGLHGPCLVMLAEGGGPGDAVMRHELPDRSHWRIAARRWPHAEIEVVAQLFDLMAAMVSTRRWRDAIRRRCERILAERALEAALSEPVVTPEPVGV